MNFDQFLTIFDLISVVQWVKTAANDSLSITKIQAGKLVKDKSFF